MAEVTSSIESFKSSSLAERRNDQACIECSRLTSDSNTLRISFVLVDNNPHEAIAWFGDLILQTKMSLYAQEQGLVNDSTSPCETAA